MLGVAMRITTVAGVPRQAMARVRHRLTTPTCRGQARNRRVNGRDGDLNH